MRKLRFLRPAWLLIALVGLGGCPDDPTPPSSTATAAATASASAAPKLGKLDEAAVQNTVIAGMKAGLERHDLTAYMLVWATDARLALARSEAPGPYEVKLRRADIEQTKQVRFAGPPPDVTLSFEDTKVSFEKGQAKLSWTLVATSKDMIEKSGEMYLLRKVGTAWRITRNRVWPIETKRGDEVIRYDEATWEKLDAAVAEANKSKDDRRIARALADAYRFAEAHAVIKAVCERPGASKADWELRAQLAALAGKGADALAALSRARDRSGDGAVGARDTLSPGQ
jgi:hypothetical protein